jgi:hypothetical protein
MSVQIELSVIIWLVVIFESKHLSAIVLAVLKLSVAVCLDTVTDFVQLEHVTVDMATRTLSDNSTQQPQDTVFDWRFSGSR